MKADADKNSVRNLQPFSTTVVRSVAVGGEGNEQCVCKSLRLESHRIVANFDVYVSAVGSITSVSEIAAWRLLFHLHVVYFICSFVSVRRGRS
ncbi:hypothetical protein MPTK1_5g10890 [Marchantia polymorpha subsp. ruderalis]|uniref:Uncharacterized protein n=2 Tax=Marchantia polymorpha TaxID=3197 RepID=A0AAF6BH36_MARPO|nr:hypothetical protein MARPO_0093s0010 [Marchantia polymorpha]BBN11320.1 hypothetical protein Mp_5g10890 [Marchantia polymorpha subsp. ruderalis]|eukprot:PTQ32926.1 hypothetical protein MARPO_0093s0010 [Marchantia polymorpha]